MRLFPWDDQILEGILGKVTFQNHGVFFYGENRQVYFCDNYFCNVTTKPSFFFVMGKDSWVTSGKTQKQMPSQQNVNRKEPQLK
jgi:hypothetical protein